MKFQTGDSIKKLIHQIRRTPVIGKFLEKLGFYLKMV